MTHDSSSRDLIAVSKAQPPRLRAWMSRHRTISSVATVLSVSAIVFLVIPHGQYCEIPKDSGHEYCSAHNVLSAAVFFLLDLFSNFGAAITGLATIAIAGFTATLWRATSRMQNATSDTLDHLRKEFLATHRPQLIVRMGSLLTQDNPEDPANWHYIITYEVVNVGTTPAENIRLFVGEKWDTTADPQPISVDLSGDEIQKFVSAGLPSGAKLPQIHIGDVSKGTFFNAMYLHERSEYVFFGKIEYEDAAHVRRETGFARRYDSKRKRFLRDDDPDYEYAD